MEPQNDYAGDGTEIIRLGSWVFAISTAGSRFGRDLPLPNGSMN